MVFNISSCIILKSSLDKHKAEAHNPNKIVEEDEDKYICEHCAKTFAIKGSLTRHIKRKHTTGSDNQAE